MEMSEFYNLIISVFTEAGLKIYSQTNIRNRIEFVVNDELYTKQTEGYSYAHLYGISLAVERVNRSNGTAADVSYYFDTMIWRCSSGHGVRRTKLSSKQTEKTLTKKLIVIAEDYKQYVKEHQYETSNTI